ncbi:hypothetical protein NCS57_00284800 [Fusarium keratoplasticum]|uniref:Uncharacterized protein n=1 Tax=Fusarium keratoplasticum TaxID=1328300 RepID=A0ACC0RD16_9HYPO|nr:hypothetical protein NCS57_00284800 [Fusarium keratoplasticum]KAI8680051.1 hypothetical protein NCS57_00284800 [Fusarium keratoplasticum]
MDLEPTKNANVGITTQSVASIDLDLDPSQYIPPPPTEWGIEEQQREYERRSRAKASQWVNRQDSSRPAPGAIINSLPLDERMRHNDKIVGLVDNILHQTSHSDASKSKPSSVQTTAAFAIAARHNYDGNTFQDRLLGSNAAFQAPEPTPSFPDRNSKYHDTGHHDEDPTNQQLFGNFIYTGNFQESGVPQIQTTPIDDFNMALPAETPFSQPTPSQATASQVPSTMGEPLPMPSPDMDEPSWLPDLDDDDDDPFQYIGSNPALQESISRQDAPIRQQTVRPRDSPPNGLIPFGQQVKIERDSAYESMGQTKTEPDNDSFNAMYQTEPDKMEIEGGFGQDLTQWFDFEGACESPRACQETPFASQHFF